MAVEPANPCDPEPGLALPSRHKGRRKTRNRSSGEDPPQLYGRGGSSGHGNSEGHDPAMDPVR
jgi:hypothetical protein